jgi:hypothetical protein
MRSLDGSASFKVSPDQQWVQLQIPVRMETTCAASAGGGGGGTGKSSACSFANVQQQFHASALPARYGPLYHLIVDAMPHVVVDGHKCQDWNRTSPAPGRDEAASTFCVHLPTPAEAMRVDEGFAPLLKLPLSELLCRAILDDGTGNMHAYLPQDPILVEHMDGMVFFPAILSGQPCVEVNIVYTYDHTFATA